MHQLSVSWHIIPLKFFNWKIIFFGQKEPINVQFFKLLSALMKVHPIPWMPFLKPQGRRVYSIFASLFSSLSNSGRHSANANVIADLKSKIIVSRRHFFADVIFSATSKVQNYQNKTAEKYLYLKKYLKYRLTTYFKEF